jgi:hypothetical protein
MHTSVTRLVMQVTYNERAHFTVAGVVLVETNIVASNSASIGHLLQLLLTAPLLWACVMGP